MIAIIDYGCGNLRSVKNALERLGCSYTVTADAEVIRKASKVILPGVGNAAEAMANLEKAGLVKTVKELRVPVLGICVGMQIMCRDSEEGPVKCMGIFDAHICRFPADKQAKVPHMGWNGLANLTMAKGKIFNGLHSGDSVYFVHSYKAGLCQDTIATCTHGNTVFSAALKYENFYGVQFHPEKSGEVGELILKNFVNL